MKQINWTKGDVYSEQFVVYSNGVVLPLTGIVPSIQIVDNKISMNNIVVRDGVVTDAANGIFEIEFLASDFTAAGSYHYRIILDFTASSEKKTMPWGVFNVEP